MFSVFAFSLPLTSMKKQVKNPPLFLFIYLSCLFGTISLLHGTALKISTKASHNHEFYSVSIIQTQFNYTYHVNPGPYLIRLQFYPISYPGLNISNALFSVSTGPYTLLRTSASSYGSVMGYRTTKEFCVKVSDQMLKVTFLPSQDTPDAYAFVNDIEVLQVPPNLYIQEKAEIPFVGNLSNFVESAIALETMYRVNVGGHFVPSEDDTSGMSRAWLKDDNFLIRQRNDTDIIHSNNEIKYGLQAPSFAAPKEVYATARTIVPDNIGSRDNLSMSWLFPVESGFDYLIRLHFCEVNKMVKRSRPRVFQVYVNNQTVENRADVVQWSGGVGVPVFRDYVLNLSGKSQEIRISIQTVSESADVLSLQAILNGLEIFKVSDNSNNLAGSNPFAAANTSSTSSVRHKHRHTHHLIKWTFFGILLGLFFLCIICFVIPMWVFRNFSWLLKISEEWQSETCKQFSFAEMKAATNNFSHSFLIGAGGFGKVYKGNINGSATTVAIKRANPSSHQGLIEFQTEILMLSKLRHCHLVSLVGYCMERKEMILAYDYMAEGSLCDHLYNTNKPPLSWMQRLKICVGAARGIHYLHTGTKQMIIHRDIKTSNILLDTGLVPKVSDFGLSKVGPGVMTQSKTHVSTLVKGSFGYLDPEYFRRQKLTEKSDVYSFGVVLFEILCARPAVKLLVKNDEDENEKYLADWVLHCSQMRILEQIIDPYLKGKIAANCFKTYTEIAMRCLADRGSERPSMGEVLWNLETAMQQQDLSDLEQSKAHGDQTNSETEIQPFINHD